MAIPGFETLMLPLLKIAADGQLRRNLDYENILAEEFSVNTEDRAIRLPSGHLKFRVRVHWASVYLKRAGLLNYPQRGLSGITARGREVLQTNPARITLGYLNQFEEFRDFRATPKTAEANPSPTDATDTETPDETLTATYSLMQQNLATDLLDMVRQATPSFFERLVLKLILAMGYGGAKLKPEEAGEVTGKSGDFGIDGIVNEDTLGLDQIFLQAKRWSGNVGRPEIHKFVGALAGQHGRKGILITTSAFTREAEEYITTAKDYRVILIDGKKLAELMVRYNVGVTVRAVHEVKTIDTDFFQDTDA